MKRLYSPRFQSAMLGVSRASTVSEIVEAWIMLEGKYPDLKAVVSLDEYDRKVFPDVLKKYLTGPDSYLLPYFKSTSLFFISDEILESMVSNKEAFLRIDYSLMFDTNICTYVNNIVRGKPLGSLEERVPSLLHDVVYHDLNFDHLFYMIENIKLFKPSMFNSQSRLDFWQALDKSFRENLVSLHIFRTVDNQAYKQEFVLEYKSSYIRSARNAIDATYDFYMSDFGKDKMHGFLWLQRLVLLNLIGMLKIQHSSNKSAKNKIAEYMKYVNDVVGVYMDRDLIVACKYFENRKNVKILEKVQKGVKNKSLLKLLDNIAWDLVSPRIMEQMIIGFGKGGFFIPFFLSLDKKLKQILSLYTIKAEIYSEDAKTFMPIPELNTHDYLHSLGCGRIADLYFQGPESHSRRSRPAPTREAIHHKIFQEYRQLKQVLK